MPSGGKRKGAGRRRKLNETDHLDIAHDYRALLDWRRLTKQPGPHRDWIIERLATDYTTPHMIVTPRMIVRVLEREYTEIRVVNRKYTEIKTAKRIRSSK
jgi:hypothetical protein